MIGISILENQLQRYVWGSETAIQELLGMPEGQGPIAELWMGAHPKASSMAVAAGKRMSLEEMVHAWPEQVLGPEVSASFSNRLPFLFKVLAVSRPLSIQAHPDRVRAEEGFARENRMGIPINAGERNYRDERHKPELVCALTGFQGLVGFREPHEIARLTRDLLPASLESELLLLDDYPAPEGMRLFFSSLLGMATDRRREIVRSARDAAERRAPQGGVFPWLARLARLYPGDIAALAPLFMNLVELVPGEALFVPSGELHAYLEGMAVELMANSDNVVRGGLTRKHLDVEELLRIVNFTGRPPKRVLPVSGGEGERIYPAPATEFLLSLVSVSPDAPYAGPGRRSMEILLCTEGRGVVTDLGNAERLSVVKGSCIMVPACVPRYRIEGEAVFYRASVPLGESASIDRRLSPNSQDDPDGDRRWLAGQGRQ